MAGLNRPDWQREIALDRVTQAYALKDPSILPQLQKLLAGIPMPSREVIPHPQRITEEKQDFERKLQKVRTALQ